MAKAEKQYKLDLKRVLAALDTGDKNFYSNLTDEEKKGYTPLILMRYMSFLSDQSRFKEYAVIANNDIVNMGFWQLSKYPELQHLLLCAASTGSNQYHQWVKANNKRVNNSAVDSFFIEIHPGVNQEELEMIKSQYDKTSFNRLLIEAGKSEVEIKSLMDDWKKQTKNG